VTRLPLKLARAQRPKEDRHTRVARIPESIAEQNG
jgi:hypothetical protein